MPATVEDIIHETEVERETSSAPPTFGRCPICRKALRPRCKVTGTPQTPPVGTGFESRAKCSGCGYILYYKGNSEWGVLTNDMLNDDDDFIAGMPLH